MAGGNDSFTKVLLHMDGSNGGTTFTDSNAGGSAHTWTAASATTSTTQIKFGAASMACGAAVGSITTPDHADFTLGSNDFTVDCWFYRSGGDGTDRIIAAQLSSSVADFAWDLFLTATNVLQFNFTTGGTTATMIPVIGSTTITTTGWHHVAVTRSGSTFRIFLDGVQDVTITNSGVIWDSSQALGVGVPGSLPTAYWNGFIDEFRLSVGIARWTANFTPPTIAYEPVANVNVVGVTATGIAGTIGRTVDRGVIGVAGVGICGTIRASTSTFLVGTAGVGTAGSMSGADTTGLVGVSGAGVAFGITPSVYAFIIDGAIGTGTAGSVAGADASAPQGVAGIGIAGSLQVAAEAFFHGAVGIGVAGQITGTPGGSLFGVSCEGVAGEITVISNGGGTSGSAAGDGNRRKKRRTGLEPIAKYPEPKPSAPKSIPLPPAWVARPASPPLAPALPVERIDREFARSVPRIAQSIMDAEDITDIRRYLGDQEQDEQDMADIADVLAMLETQE